MCIGNGLFSGKERLKSISSRLTASIETVSLLNSLLIGLILPTISLPDELGVNEWFTFTFWLFADIPDSDGNDDGDLEDFYELDQLLLTAMIKTISTSEIQDLIQQTEDYIEQNFDSNQSNIKISGLSVFINDFVNIIVKSSMTSILLSIVLILIITGLFFVIVIVVFSLGL